MNNFKEFSELEIGSIIEVQGTQLRVELDDDITDLTRMYRGHVYPIGQFASIVKIHYGRQILLAYVDLLRMRSEVAEEEGRSIPASEEDTRILEVSLFGQGQWNSRQETFDLRRGIQSYPLPGQSVYLTTRTELRAIFQDVKESAEAEGPSVEIGTYVGTDSTSCVANIDKLFGLHCAVLGSTGAGKSATVASILHSLLNGSSSDGASCLRPSVVVIDPHGEYADAFRDRGVVYRAHEGQSSEIASSQLLDLPYWTLSGDEFKSLVVKKSEYGAERQNEIVQKALKHAKLVQKDNIKEIELNEDEDQWIHQGESVDDYDHPEKPTLKGNFSLDDFRNYDHDTPDPFSLKEFENHIRYAQLMREKDGEWDPKPPSKRRSHNSVLDKLRGLKNDPRLKFLMEDYEDNPIDLADILLQFIGSDDEHDNRDVRIIDISSLPSDVAGTLTATISRLLFQYKIEQTRDERENNPVLFVCEEAHRYVPDSGEAQYQTAQQSIRRIAREGRKYGLGLMLVSQRPADVESTVLSQCNSWIVMRLSNAEDQNHVRRFLPDSLTRLSSALPSLARREALFVGQAATIPARIQVRALPDEKLPESDDISFVEGWRTDPTTREDLSSVIQRWRDEPIASENTTTEE